MGDDYAMPIMQLHNACFFPWNYIEPIKQSFFKSYFSKGKFMPQVLTVPAKILPLVQCYCKIKLLKTLLIEVKY